MMRAGQRRIVRNDVPDRGDALVVAIARGRDRLQCVGAALALQCLDGLGHVGPQIASRQDPARWLALGVLLLDQAMQIDRLMSPVE
jgi:hypothetical protein